MWFYRGQKRPDFATQPGPGQESAWDYPRPPVAERCSRLVEVRDGDTLIAQSSDNYRLLETASPPGFYLPADTVRWDFLQESRGSSACEWKGAARYWALARNPEQPIGWDYPQPRPGFAMLTGHVAFYPGRIACFVDGERVAAQTGHFYGGWITTDVVGPFKGEPGTGHW
jgi:uncharacterized protein (DUF427 family)